MKQLLIMRHAKAEPPEYHADDLSRPLAGKGERHAPVMGAVLDRADLVPEHILTSPAIRARRTAELAAAACGASRRVEVMDGIYDASVETLMELLRGVEEPASRVMLVGHNPGLEGLVWNLCEAPPAGVPWSGLRLPTGAVVLVEVAVDLWERIEPGCGRIEWSLPPKLAVAINSKL